MLYSFPAHFGNPALLCYRNLPYVLRIWRAHIGVTFLCFGNSQWCLYDTQSNSDWLFTTWSSVLEADWLLLADFNYLSPKRHFRGPGHWIWYYWYKVVSPCSLTYRWLIALQGPWHTLTKTAKKTSDLPCKLQLFRNCNRFYTAFYMCNNFHTSCLREIVAVTVVECKGLNAQLHHHAVKFYFYFVAQREFICTSLIITHCFSNQS